MTVILLTFRDLSFRKYYVIIVACPRKKNGISFQFYVFIFIADRVRDKKKKKHFDESVKRFSIPS